MTLDELTETSQPGSKHQAQTCSTTLRVRKLDKTRKLDKIRKHDKREQVMEEWVWNPGQKTEVGGLQIQG